MTRTKSLLTAVAAYTAWGFFPIYWKFLHAIPSTLILAHRILWCCVFYALFWFWQRRPDTTLVPKRAELQITLGAGFLVTLNWLTYIYAVNTGRVLEGSLAYFLVPLLNVFLGKILFGESLSLVRRIALAVAMLGVAFLALRSPQFPWLALVMAITFSLYGSLKKQLNLPVFQGSFLESLWVLLPALAAIFYWQGVLGVRPTNAEWAFFVGSGIVTGGPLVLFAAAARALPYSTMGFMQFITPTLQFLLAVFLYKEPFTPAYAIAFTLIWTGVGLYLVTLLRERQA